MLFTAKWYDGLALAELDMTYQIRVQPGFQEQHPPQRNTLLPGKGLIKYKSLLCITFPFIILIHSTYSTVFPLFAATPVPLHPLLSPPKPSLASQNSLN